MVIKNILLATEAGLGHGETAIFPVSVFKVKEGVNYNPGDPNYDLFELACRVSAKRLFPNFVFLDAPYNLQYYKPGVIESEIATMGCVDGNEVIVYRCNGDCYVESFKRAYDRLSTHYEAQAFSGVSHYVDTSFVKLDIYDSNAGEFIHVKKIIKNDDVKQWAQLSCNTGRTLVVTPDHPLYVCGRGRVEAQDIQPGESIFADIGALHEDLYDSVTDNYSKAVMKAAGETLLSSPTEIEKRGVLTDEELRVYYSLITNDETDVSAEISCCGRHIPNDVFRASRELRYEYLSGVLESVANTVAVRSADGEAQDYWVVTTTGKKEIMLQLMYLVQSFGVACEIRCNDVFLDSYTIMFKKFDLSTVPNAGQDKRMMVMTVTDKLYIVKNMDSYDVETVTDQFSVSGILSHNCRTRVIGNVYDPSREIVAGRGNLSFTSINLPRLGILAHGDIDKFFKSLDDMIDLVIKQLLDRFHVQCQKFVYNYPMLMGQGVWIDSENLDWSDSVAEVLKHGTLSIGFIGLAECLTALIGKHHGESEEAQQLGLRIVKHMRDRMDAEAEKRKLNFGLIGTPAEGLSGRFLRIDRDRFGIIPGVTDKEWYTNSSHIPVEYQISAARKIELEAPYHELENAGHIAYVELSGDTSNNLQAFMKIVRYMHDNNVGYGAINHPVDQCRLCGYQGIIGNECPQCGALGNDVNIARIRRITGYLVGTLDRFNNAKRAEEHARVKHDRMNFGSN